MQMRERVFGFNEINFNKMHFNSVTNGARLILTEVTKNTR